METHLYAKGRATWAAVNRGHSGVPFGRQNMDA